MAFCFSKYLQVLSLYAGLHIPRLTADRNTFIDDSCWREWRLAEFKILILVLPSQLNRYLDILV